MAEHRDAARIRDAFQARGRGSSSTGAVDQLLADDVVWHDVAKGNAVYLSEKTRTQRLNVRVSKARKACCDRLSLCAGMRKFSAPRRTRKTRLAAGLILQWKES